MTSNSCLWQTHVASSHVENIDPSAIRKVAWKNGSFNRQTSSQIDFSWPINFGFIRCHKEALEDLGITSFLGIFFQNGRGAGAPGYPGWVSKLNIEKWNKVPSSPKMLRCVFFFLRGLCITGVVLATKLWHIFFGSLENHGTSIIESNMKRSRIESLCSSDAQVMSLLSKKSPTGPTKKRTPKKPEYLIAVATYWTAPLKINMEHNHGGLENHVPF